MCGKRGFETIYEARRALRAIRLGHRWSGTGYYLCPDCKSYHLSGRSDRGQSFKLRSGK